jgi:hypothetical protein
MSQPARARRVRTGSNHDERETPVRRPLTPPQALLALQASAGNRAVTAHLQRYYEHPSYKRTQPGSPMAPSGEPLDPGWVENGRPPEGDFLIQEADAWWRFNGEAGAWEAYAGPPKAEEKPKAPTFRPAKPIIADLGADTGMNLGPSAVPGAIVDEIFSYLDAPALIAMREMDTYFRKVGSTALRNHLKPRLGKKLGALSSLEDKPMVEQYHDTIAERAPESLVIASDQVNEKIVEKIVDGFPNAVKVYRGEHGKGADKAVGNVDYKTVSGPKPEKTSKMHNKAVVGVSDKDKGQFLLSGSPNLTEGGMTRNTESAAVVRFPGIAQMYKEYIERIGSGKAEDEKFSKAVKGFNESNPVGIRAALAPFVDIGETLKTELKGADEVTMRMFLVGSVQDDDPVDALCALAKAGATVTVIVDRSQAATTPYVRMALDKLQKAGVTVASETGKSRDSIMHDKLIFAHYPETDTADERYTVMIGSSGLTKNVVENTNYENLLIVDDKSLFDALKVHHTKAEPKRAPGIPAIDPRSPLGYVVKALTTLIPTRTSPRVKQSLVKKQLRGQEQNTMLDDAIEMLGMNKKEEADKSKSIGY